MSLLDFVTAAALIRESVEPLVLGIDSLLNTL